MNQIQLFLIGILLVVMVYVFGVNEYFSNTDTDNKLKSKVEIKQNNQDLILVTFSQLKNELKNELIKKYLINNNVNLSKIFDKELTAILKFIEKDKKLVPLIDVVIAVQPTDLKDLTDGDHLGFNDLNNPIYSKESIYSRNPEQRFGFKENLMVISMARDSSVEPVNVSPGFTKVGDKFINLIPAQLNNKNIYFIGLK